MLRAQAIGRLQPLAALLLAFSCGVALAAPQPITRLPLQAEGENRWRLPAGDYPGQFSLDQPMELICDSGAVFQAGGEGNGLLIEASDVTVDGCTVVDWGRDLTAMNAGIFIQPKAQRVVIRNNRLRGPGFGVWVDSSRDVSLIGNRIEGDTSIRSQDRGNGIHLYAVSGARIIDNQVRHTRDGIYIDTSNGNHIEGNVLEDLRYGVH